MDCIQTTNAQTDKWGTGRNGFSAGNATTGVLATLLSPDWCDGVQEEILNAIVTGGGYTPDGDDLTQLLATIRKIGRENQGVYAADIGAANAMLATCDPAVTALHDGERFVVLVAATNTGATTFTPATGVLSASPVVGLGGVALVGGELVAGGLAVLVWDATNSRFVLLHCTGAALQVPAGSYLASTPAASNNSKLIASTAWIWTNIQVLVASCIAAVATAAGFAYLLASPGYIKFPTWLGSLIFQWGTGTCPASGTAGSFTYPLAFTSTVFIAPICIHEGTDASVNFVVNRSGLTKFLIYSNFSGSTTLFSYIVVGV